jgi:hypothetical protein
VGFVLPSLGMTVTSYIGTGAAGAILLVLVAQALRYLAFR